MKDGPPDITIDELSEIKNDTYCLYTGPQESLLFEYQFLANFYGEVPFYQLYDEVKHDNYTLHCVSPQLNATMNGVQNLDTLNEFISLEWVLRRPVKFDFIKHNFESATHDAAVVVWIYDDETPEEEVTRMINELQIASNEMRARRETNDRIGNVIYSYTHIDKLEEEYQEMFIEADIPRPLLMMFDPQGEGDTFYHLYPGTTCMKTLEQY